MPVSSFSYMGKEAITGKRGQGVSVQLCNETFP